VPDDQARVIFGEWKSVKPYIRIVPQPTASGGDTGAGRVRRRGLLARRRGTGG